MDEEGEDDLSCFENGNQKERKKKKGERVKRQTPRMDPPWMDTDVTSMRLTNEK